MSQRIDDENTVTIGDASNICTQPRPDWIVLLIAKIIAPQSVVNTSATELQCELLQEIELFDC